MFELKPGELTLQDINMLLTTHAPIQLASNADEKIDAAFRVVQTMVGQEQSVYGINTGFGKLAHTKICRDDLMDLQRRIVLSHAAGVGAPLDDDTVKLVLLLKINSLARGYSGVSRALIDQLIVLYNAHIYPVIPEQGSVGASGDLAPLAHMALVLMGEGEARLNGKRLPASVALSRSGLQPIVLGEKEGLALLNGTQVSTAIAIIGLLKTQRNFAIGTIAGALSLDAASASLKPFNALIAHAKNNRGQVVFSALIEQLLQDSAIQRDHVHCSRVQDPYSLRCQPQVMGAVWSYLQDSQTHLMTHLTHSSLPPS